MDFNELMKDQEAYYMNKGVTHATDGYCGMILAVMLDQHNEINNWFTYPILDIKLNPKTRIKRSVNRLIEIGLLETKTMDNKEWYKLNVEMYEELTNGYIEQD